MPAASEPHRKLAALANFLDDLPHDRFHMPAWGSDDAAETSCGTAGCACGWAATVYNLACAADITPRHAADRIRKVLACIDPEALEARGAPEYKPGPCVAAGGEKRGVANAI